MASSSSAVGVGREQASDMARLAQDSKPPIPHVVSVDMLAKMGIIPLNADEIEKRRLLCIAYRPTASSDMYGNLRYKICVILGQEDDPKRVQCLLFCVKGLRLKLKLKLELEDGVQAICRAALDVVDNQLLQSCHDAENAASLKGGGTCCFIRVMLNKGEDTAEQLAHKVLAADADKLAASEGMSQALDEAGPKFALVYEQTYKKIPVADKDLNLWWMGDHPLFKGPAEENEAFYWKPKGWAWPSPPAVVPRSNGGPPLDEFTNPGDWPDYQVDDGLSVSEIMSRKKAAQMRRI